MRLIDADKFKADLEKAISKNENMDCLDFLRASSVIDAHPTAFDPDKVVMQLERLKTINVDIGFGTTVSTLRKDVVLEIVKAGGTDGVE